MKKIRIGLWLVFCLCLAGCGSVDKPVDVSSFLAELDATTTATAEKIATNDLDDAKTTFAAKKDILKTNFAALAKLPADKISKEDQLRLLEGMEKNRKVLRKEIDIRTYRNSSPIDSTDTVEKMRRIGDDNILKKILADFDGIFTR